MTDIKATSALARLLEDRLVRWEQARKPQELKLLECYQDVMRIPRDDDTRNTGVARSKKAASLFIGSTRNKVRAARAKINDALFGSGSMPFDTTPTNEELRKFADTTEDIVTEQLERMKFDNVLKAGVGTLATYGTGFIFGPFVRSETLTETQADNSDGYSQIKEQKYEFDCPYFELGKTLDVYPDPEARTIGDGLGVFWATMESPHTIAAWKSDKSYSDIDQALLGAGDRGNETGGDVAAQLRGNVEFWNKNGRIKVARFFGKVPRSALKEGESEDAVEMVDVIAIVAGGVVVKVSESPYAESPVFRCVYEDVEGEMWGVGVSENNAPHQKIVNAGFRLFMEGKGMALLGTKSVDRSMFMATENFQKYPGKVYQMKPGLTPEDRSTAIIDHKEEDITDGWLDVIRISEQFSDDDTGITKYSQGDDASSLNKTASGISMIMSASSLPVKEVIQGIDQNWIEPVIEAIINWDLKYLEVETVQKIHGDEAAQVWQQIKEFGKSSFMNWQATGTSSFMQKEILVNKIRAFADFAMGNELTAPMIDARELLEQTWSCMEIGKESPIIKEDGEERVPPQAKQEMDKMQQHIQQLEMSLEELGQNYNELNSEADAKREERQVKAYDATTKRLQILAPYLTPDMIMQLADNIGLNVLNDPDLSEVGGEEGEQAESALEQPMMGGEQQPMMGQQQPEMMGQQQPEMMEPI